MRKTFFLTMLVVVGLAGIFIVEKNKEKNRFHQESTIDSWSTGFECENIKSCDISYILVRPDADEDEGAKLLITKNKSHSGMSSLYSVVPTAKFEWIGLTGMGLTSKAMVARTGFMFAHGDHVVAKAWFYLPSSSKGTVTVMDFETSERMGNPGVRFQLREGVVIFNRDKIKIKPHTFKSLFDIPYDEWFLMRVELVLGDKNNGRIKIFINDVLAMDRSGATIIPKIKSYDTFQSGLTARTDNPYSMWTDDISVYVQKQ